MDFSWLRSPFWCCTIQLSFLYHFPWHFCISREVSAWESRKHQPPPPSLLWRLEKSHFTWLCLSPGITLAHRGHFELWEPVFLSDSSRPGRYTRAHRYTYSMFNDRGWMCMDSSSWRQDKYHPFTWQKPLIHHQVFIYNHCWHDLDSNQIFSCSLEPACSPFSLAPFPHLFPLVYSVTEIKIDV